MIIFTQKCDKKSVFYQQFILPWIALGTKTSKITFSSSSFMITFEYLQNSETYLITKNTKMSQEGQNNTHHEVNAPHHVPMPKQCKVKIPEQPKTDQKVQEPEKVEQHYIEYKVETKHVMKDIGVFDYHVNSPCQELLTQQIHAEKEQIQGLVDQLHGDQSAEFSTVNLDVEKEANTLIEYADKIYNQEKGSMPEEELDDLKINLTRQELIDLIGLPLCERLETIFNAKPTEIIIRRGQSHGKMINFHTDVSLKTLQLSLNSDESYEGGRLVYASKEALAQPKRTQGTVTVHDNRIVHGVTKFSSGIRYGLFFLCK